LDASITHYQFVSSLGGRVTTSGNHTKKLSIYIVWYYCWGGDLIYIYLSMYLCIFAMKFWGSFWLSPPIHRIVAQRLFRVEFKDVSCSWNWKCNDHLPFLSLSLSHCKNTEVKSITTSIALQVASNFGFLHKSKNWFH
jgi:hypothetical protein